jgi:hypothetical protein
MAAPGTILDRPATYAGEALTVRSLEDLIQGERAAQDRKVKELQTLRERNGAVQQDLGGEIDRLRRATAEVHRDGPAPERGLLRRFVGLFVAREAPAIAPRSVEQLLREQYDLSARRVKEAAEFADRLAAAERELYDEIDRLNGRILESSRNRVTAAAFLGEVEALRGRLVTEIGQAAPGSVEALDCQAQLDRAQRLLAEHATQLQLYHTAAERLGGLKDSTRLLADTIAGLRGDITQYVMAASEKLDLCAAQIRAIGAAADATATLFEMRRSLEAMGESLNQTTRFVAETQRYFRENLDTLVGNLEVYDAETRASLELNLELSRAADESRIARLVEAALPAAPSPHLLGDGERKA